jgi:D-inositol-3-phosphate glycosyltransferase
MCRLKTSSLKIAMLFDNLTISGGGQRLLLSLAHELIRYGHRITVFTPVFNPTACYPDLCRNLDIRALKTVSQNNNHGSSGWLSRAGRNVDDYFLKPRQLAELVTERYDIVNPHERPMHRAAVCIKRHWGTPIVWMFNDPGSWEINYHENAGMPASISALKGLALRRADRPIVCNVDAVAVLSHGVQAIFHREFGIYPHVVRCGLDKEFLQSPCSGDKIRDRLAIGANSILVLFLAVLSPSRRVQDLMQAVSRVRISGRDVRLAVVGSSRYAPEYLAQLRHQAATLNISDHVTFVSHSVTEEERRDWYYACDIFVWPNEAQSWGLAPLEAMLCGKPVIVSIGAGVHEVLHDEEDALLVPPRRPDLLAAALMRLINNPELRKQIVAHGTALVRERFSWPQMAAQMLPIFHRAVNDRSETGEERQPNPQLTHASPEKPAV